MPMFRPQGWLLCLWYCFLMAALPGQNLPSFSHLTVDDGLAHNTVHAVLQDSDGFFWIGTRRGLNCYDGNYFRTFSPQDEVSPLKGPTVLSLLEGVDGRIWAGHRNAGISIYDKATGEIIPFSLGTQGTYPIDWATIGVHALFRDSKNRTWIGTLGGGVVVLDAKGEFLYHFATYADTEFSDRISNDFVFGFAETTTGDVYVATSGRGLNRVRPEQRTWEVLHAPDDKDLNSFEKALHVAVDGSLWIATSGSGLYRYQPNSDGWEVFPAGATVNHPIVTDVTSASDGRIWLTTDGGGLNVFDPAFNHWQTYRYTTDRSTSLNTDALYNLSFDRAGNLMVGTFNGGLNVYRAAQPPYRTDRHYAAERQAGLRSVLSIAQDRNGTVWLGTDGGGLFYFKDWGDEIVPVWADQGNERGPQAEGENIDGVITALAPVEEGVWFGSYAGGLGFLDARSQRVKKFRHDNGDPGSLTHDNVWDIAVDSSGGIWIGMLGGGLDYLSPTGGNFRHYTDQSGDSTSLSSRQVIDVLLDRNGRYLWVATENAGLNRLEIPTGRVRRFRHDPMVDNSLSDDRLRHLFQAEDGVLWVGTENHGLNALTPESEYFRRYNEATGYPFVTANGITMDTTGNYWVSGLTSITRWNPADDSFRELPDEQELGYNLYNLGAAICLQNGDLAFGGVNGFSLVSPTNIAPAPAPPEVLLSELRLANRTIIPGEFRGRTILTGDPNNTDTEVRLSYQDRGIAFRFASPAYANPAEVRYSFRLEGFDDNWVVAPAGEHTAYYSSLKGGKYRLFIRAAGEEGDWGPSRSISVLVAPPFYRTTLFLVVMVGLLIGLVFMLNRFLLARQREAYQREALKREQEILRLRNRNLREEVAAKQSELGASLLQMAHKNEFLNNLKLKIRQLDSKSSDGTGKSLRSVVRVIDHELKQEDYWEQFQLIFDQGYQDFVSRLRQRHPRLTTNEGRLCCFLRMELNNREIAGVLNITLNGVEQAKYRLKKKLDLPREISLNEYVRQLG